MSVTPSYVSHGTPWAAVGVATPGAPDDLSQPPSRYLLLTVMTNGNAPSSITNGNGASVWGSPIVGPVSVGTPETIDGLSLWVYGKWGAGTGNNLDDSAILGDGGDLQFGVIHGYDDVDRTTPVNVTATSTQAATTSVTMPGVTTTGANCLITHHIGFDRDAASTANFSGSANANLTGVTETYDQIVSLGFGGGLGNVCGVKVAAGATGDTTATQAASGPMVHATVALNPDVSRAIVQHLEASIWGEGDAHGVVEHLEAEMWFDIENAGRLYQLQAEMWFIPRDDDRRRMSLM